MFASLAAALLRIYIDRVRDGLALALAGQPTVGQVATSGERI